MYFDTGKFLRWVLGTTALCFLPILLTGCGATPVTRDRDTGYLMISKGKAGFLATVTGSGDYCKVTRSNLDGITFTGELVYDDKGCRIEVVGNNESH